MIITDPSFNHNTLYKHFSSTMCLPRQDGTTEEPPNLERICDLKNRPVTELKSAGRSGTPLLSNAIITDGAWHRIGLAWDGSQRTLSVGGVVVAEDTQNSLAASTAGLYIGVGKDYAQGTYFSGLIDDVPIYNRAVSP